MKYFYLLIYFEMILSVAMFFAVFPTSSVNVSVGHKEDALAVLHIIFPLAIINWTIWMNHFSSPMTLITLPGAFVVGVCLKAKKMD